MIAISELLQPVTTQQQYNKFVASLVSVGVPANSWRPGGSLSTMLRVVAGAFAGFTNSVLGFVQSGFLETASGDWLTLVAYYIFGVTRVEATFASGQVQLTNSGGGVYTFNPGDLTVSSSVTGMTYVNTASFTLNPAQVLLVAIQAAQSGSIGSASPGDISTVVTALPGVTCTNPLSVVGIDQQADPDLVLQCQGKLASISGLGPRGAYSFAVTSATRSDGSPVNINRMQISPSSSTGTVTVSVASPSGPPLSSDITYVEASIEAIARPDTVTVYVNPVTTATVSPTLTVWCQQTSGASINAAAVQQEVLNALTTLVSTYPIGGIAKPPSTQGYLYAETVSATAQAADATIFSVDNTMADLALTTGQVAILTPTVNVRIVQIPS